MWTSRKLALVALLGSFAGQTLGIEFGPFNSYVAGEQMGDFAETDQASNAKSLAMCAALAKRKSHLYFKYEGESDTCRFGLATTRKGAGLPSNGEEGQVYEAFNGTHVPTPSTLQTTMTTTTSATASTTTDTATGNTAGGTALAGTTPAGTTAAATSSTSALPGGSLALITLGPDDDVALYSSDGSVCETSQHGIPPPPSPNTNSKGVVESRGFLYECGGVARNKCNKLDLSNVIMGWQPMPDLPSATEAADGGMVATEGGELLFFLPHYTNPNLYFFNIAGNVWDTTGDLLEERDKASIVIYDEVVYVLGGKTASNVFTKDVEKIGATTPLQNFQPHSHAVRSGRTNLACAGGIHLPNSGETGILCAGGYSNLGKSDRVQFLPIRPAEGPCRVISYLGEKTNFMAPLRLRSTVLMFGGNRNSDGYNDEIKRLNLATEEFEVIPNAMTVNKNPDSYGVSMNPSNFQC